MQGGFRPRRAGRYHGTYRPVSEINVTPLVDVMLVLLIVFMISAPLLTVGVQVDLPKTKATSLKAKADPLVLTITGKKEVYLQESPIRLGQLIVRLNAITRRNYEAPVYIRADQKLSYGHVMEIMGLLNEAGYTKVSLVSNSWRKGGSLQ
ncbi:MAG: protein TolR [Alphaproteobacteria bacterium RIFCSPLOWO2_01_FULL_45_8]|nr:MAG: protein TolR [Alphaproteobacteria bacterium GWB1_45_5]OFW76256.1 MAG: protein TolR [Alphaproteobacteria bacterium GWA1_45_9]OFW89472.1 MAG: protein TolR [Alphaproteobacteria bacterium RIFCSPHIGHO2_01_FULL_41_14]OFW96595.1 MAG: protein TolR [Alphaproteobacteria bacterium RIFCSPLOWO2_01_FULL_45_8]HCI48625.1 protein TolR [Holosporales bacterium]